MPVLVVECASHANETTATRFHAVQVPGMRGFSTPFIFHGVVSGYSWHVLHESHVRFSNLAQRASIYGISIE
jgi:hypothetical protein